MKKPVGPLIAFGGWLISLVDPPPLASLSLAQKVGRVLLLTATLVVGSVLVAMLGTLALFLVEAGWTLGNSPQFYQALFIILVGVAVNCGCVLVLLQIKRADTRLVPPKR